MSLPLSSLKVTPVVLIILDKWVVEVIRKGVVPFPFFLHYITISKLPRWRSFASSGLPRPSLPCPHIIGQPEGTGRGPVPLRELAQTWLRSAGIHAILTV
jgi:hypothetical protein